MPDDRNATKQDLEDFRSRLDVRFDRLQAQILRGFHTSARPAAVRLSHEERLTLLEERISEIERGSVR